MTFTALFQPPSKQTTAPREEVPVFKPPGLPTPVVTVDENGFVAPVEVPLPGEHRAVSPMLIVGGLVLVAGAVFLLPKKKRRKRKRR